MAAYKSKPEALGAVIAEYLKRSGLGREMKSGKLAGAWEELVGVELARRTRVAGTVRSGVVRIEVDSPGLLSELKGFRSQELLAGMRERYKTKHIRKLNFVLATWEKE